MVHQLSSYPQVRKLVELAPSKLGIVLS